MSRIDESAATPRRHHNVEVASVREGTVRVTLSLPHEANRSSDRKKMLERARRMLTAAIEEEKNRERRTRKQAAGTQRTDKPPRPGSGAWWLF